MTPRRSPFVLSLLAAAALGSGEALAQTFTNVTTTANVANSLSASTRVGTGATWGDFDGDADLDLYVTNWATSVSNAANRLYRNNGGSFTDVAGQLGVTESNSNSIAAGWVDYDNDGDLDLYVVNFFEQDQLYRNGGGTFTRVTGAAGVNVISQGDEAGATWGDADGDGFLDLYICKQNFQNEFYHNNGDGTFSEVGASAGVNDIRDSEDAQFADVDRDGDLDLYVVNREQNNAYYQNQGNGRFTDIAPSLGIDNTDVGRSAAFVDFDNDDDLDLFVANVGANALYRNDGNNVFVDVATGALRATAASYVSWMGAWADYDADGFIDVFVANGADSKIGQPSQLLRNVAGTFTDVAAASGISASASSAMFAAPADYDGDGDVDLYVVNSRYPTFEASVLYRNTTAGTSPLRVGLMRVLGGERVGCIVRLLRDGKFVALRTTSWGADPRHVVFATQPGGTYEVTYSAAPGGRYVDLKVPVPPGLQQFSIVGVAP